MLEELVIENYAVVDRLKVRFHSGLNLLTGETGSGKSIVVDALGLLLGSRASTDMIRSGADRARVSGVSKQALLRKNCWPMPDLKAPISRVPASSWFWIARFSPAAKAASGSTIVPPPLRC